MRWTRFLHQGRPVLGRVEGDLEGELDGGVVQVHEGDLFADPRPTGQTLPAAGLEWLAPCAPRQIVGLWNNFRSAAARNGWAAPAEPLYFLKSPHCVAGHGATIPAAAPAVGRVCYEGELAVVVGRRAHRLAGVEEARACIFGHACANDVTALELLSRDPSFPQWTRAKSLPGFGALGPWIDTAFDPAGATLRTRVGGRERQNFPLDDMFFGPAELVARISQDLVLEPGDVILCGTSLGALPMKPCSVVEVEIGGLGTLRNVYGGEAAPG